MEESPARSRPAEVRVCNGHQGPAFRGRPVQTYAGRGPLPACQVADARAMWYGTLATTTPGWNNSAALSRSGVWLRNRCSHQLEGTYSGKMTVMVSPGLLSLSASMYVPLMGAECHTI